MVSIRRTNSNKNNFKKDLKMESKLKPFDKVLVRDSINRIWDGEFFLRIDEELNFKYIGISGAFKYCIPYEGNEHLLGTTDNPERCNPDRNTLFGIKLKPGYVLEFDDDEIGILFPTANGFAVSYVKGCWQHLIYIKKDSIVRIRGIAQSNYLKSGELLWEKFKKQTITKAEIAEKLNLDVNEIEISN